MLLEGEYGEKKAKVELLGEVIRPRHRGTTNPTRWEDTAEQEEEEEAGQKETWRGWQRSTRSVLTIILS